MYFWKIENLKKDICNNELSEGDKFKYLFVTLALSSVFLVAEKVFLGHAINLWDKVFYICSELIFLLGIIFSFNANGGSNGYDFLGRYLCISFVMQIRFIPLIIIFLIFQFSYYKYHHLQVYRSPLNIIPFLTIFALMYWRICKHMNDCAIHNNPK
jgi:hypothetical protein